MMENLHHHRADFSPVYDLEFYSSTPNSSARGWKDAGNNNNISSDAESGFSINVSTGKYCGGFKSSWFFFLLYFSIF